MQIFLIGRDLSVPRIPGATLVEVTHPQVAGQHISIELHRDGRMFVTDLESANGTRVNQEKTPLVPGEPRQVTWDDILYLGSFRYPLRRLQEEHLQQTMTVTDATGTFAAFVVQSSSQPSLSSQPQMPVVPQSVSVPSASSFEAPPTIEIEAIPADTKKSRMRPTISLDASEISLDIQALASSAQRSTITSVSGPASTPAPRSKRKQIEKFRHTISLDTQEINTKTSVQTLTLGRAEDNDIVLPFPSISAHHACLYRSEQRLFVADLGSTNGTFVEGRRIREVTPLFPGTRVMVANHPLLVNSDLQIEIQGSQKFRVDLDNISFWSGRHQLLDQISASFNPYEIVAIMGPSGSGKSTLLKSLIGVNLPQQGEVRFNGLSLHSHYDRFRGMIGYVPQDDILYKELTVFQSVMYTGQIRLPRDWTRVMIESRSEQILRQLGLWEHRQKAVFQLSGGQRKRLILAQELLTDPPLLFLDEPTSGLSARDSYKVVEILRQLADDGKCICLVIHQPSARIFEMMDQLLLLTYSGKLAYYGPTHQAYDYFHTERNPDELLFCLEEDKRSPEDWKQRYMRDELHHHYVRDRMAVPISLPSPKMNRKGQWSLMFRQWWLLSHRYFVIKSKDTVNTALLLLQAPIIAGLLCLLLIRMDGHLIVSHLFDQADHITAMFVLGLAALWLGCANSVREIVAERVIFLRERMINLKLSPYLCSKFTVLFLLSAIQCLLLLVICYPVLRLSGHFVTQWALLLLTSCCGLALGLFLSTIVNSSASAASILPLVLLPQIIFGGYLVPTPKTDNPIVKATSYLTMTRWSFASLLQSEYTGISAKIKYKRVLLKDIQPDGLGSIQCYPEHCVASGMIRTCKPLSELLWFRDPFQEFGFASPMEEKPWWKRPLVHNAGCLVLWIVALLLCSWIALRRTSR